MLKYDTLKRMGLAFGKVSDIPHLQVGDLVLAVFIDSGDAESPLVNIGPFGLLMWISDKKPMYRTLVQQNSRHDASEAPSAHPC